MRGFLPRRSMKILRRYSSVFQTGCLPVFCMPPWGKDFPAWPGDLTYSDGSGEPMPGEMGALLPRPARRDTVEGAVEQESGLPVFRGTATDDYPFRDRYYYMATDDGNGQTTLKIRGSDTIGGLREAEEHVIFTANPEGYMSGCLWAPEPMVNGRLCVFFAAETPLVYGAVPCDGDGWRRPAGRRQLGNLPALPHRRGRRAVPRRHHPGYDLLYGA